MKRRTLYGLSVNPFLIWTHLAFKIGEMMLASAQVIGHRTNRMALGGPTPNARDQREVSPLWARRRSWRPPNRLRRWHSA
jgi:hypothetical protein